MQLGMLFFTHLPQFILNFTNPTVLPSSSAGKPTSSILPGNIPEAKFALPALPYAYNALEPYISSQIMQIHHSKHHQTYVNNLNVATTNHVKALQESDVRSQINMQQAIKFNGGGHINHSLFWANLTPANTTQAKLESAPTLMEAIATKYLSYDAFRTEFNTALLGIQGSGWGWLVKNKKTNQLDIIATKDQDPVIGDLTPLFGVDMWEHAYYLQYFNDKASYVNGIWNIINWDTAEGRFLGRDGGLKL